MFRPWPASARKGKQKKPPRRLRGSRSHFLPVLEFLEDRWLPSSSSLTSTYLQSPLSFVANKGQTNPVVDYLSQGPGYTLFLTASGAVLSMQQAGTGGQSAVISMQIVGGNADPVVTGVDQQASKSNYFIGNVGSDWQTNAANYGEVS